MHIHNIFLSIFYTWTQNALKIDKINILHIMYHYIAYSNSNTNEMHSCEDDK